MDSTLNIAAGCVIVIVAVAGAIVAGRRRLWLQSGINIAIATASIAIVCTGSDFVIYNEVLLVCLLLILGISFRRHGTDWETRIYGAILMVLGMVTGIALVISLFE